MGLRMILQEGDPILTKSSREVTDFGERLHILLDDMRDTLELADGVGLAAPQVGVLRRVIVAAPPDEDAPGGIGQWIELVNPVLLEESGEQEDYEGCLSIPGVIGLVKRPDFVRVQAQDRNGVSFEIKGEGLLARILTHEIDHLNGKLYSRLCNELIDPDSLEDAD